MNHKPPACRISCSRCGGTLPDGVVVSHLPNPTTGELCKPGGGPGPPRPPGSQGTTRRWGWCGYEADEANLLRLLKHARQNGLLGGKSGVIRRALLEAAGRLEK